MAVQSAPLVDFLQSVPGPASLTAHALSDVKEAGSEHPRTSADVKKIRKLPNLHVLHVYTYIHINCLMFYNLATSKVILTRRDSRMSTAPVSRFGKSEDLDLMGSNRGGVKAMA